MGLLENVEIVNYVPHQESIKYLYNSSALLLVIPDFNGNSGILTGKLFEYLATKIPVVGIGPTNGDAADIINDCSAGKMHDYSAVKELTQYLESLFDIWEENKTHEPDYNEINNYSRKVLTSKLVELF